MQSGKKNKKSMHTTINVHCLDCTHMCEGESKRKRWNNRNLDESTTVHTPDRNEFLSALIL